MSTIQDIHTLAERIYDIVQDYVGDGLGPDNDKISDIANSRVFLD